MNRQEFTKNITNLLSEMIKNGDNPIIDYVKRSNEEQKRLFDAKLSKCDGFKNISAHQKSIAMDIYLLDNNGKLLDWNAIPEKRDKYHSYWMKLNGKSMIKWDAPHFEG